MVEKIKGYGKQTFASLSVYNYRLYFTGQAISLIGTWLQAVAQVWLALQLTHSATMIGLLTATQFLPVLLFGAFGGVITDRFNKRKILYCTQTMALLLALTLALLVSFHLIHVWMIFVLAGCLGFVNVVDNPTRQTFIMEMVGRDKLQNAISLNSIEVNLTRVVGPAIAALLIAHIGIAECFYLNAASYIAVLICLRLMNGRELHAGARATKMKGQLKAGLQYVWHTPVLRDVLIMMAIVGTLAYEFPVVLPVFAQITFHSDAASYALLMSAMSLGSVIGGLLTASRKRTLPYALAAAAAMFGVCMIAVSLVPTLALAALMMVFVGIGSIMFMSMGNSILQLQSDPGMRGRVMSLWTVAFLGSTPIGGPIIGWISQHYSPRAGLATGGVAALCAALLGAWMASRQLAAASTLAKRAEQA